MKLRTRARDCLYINWALPHEAAPLLPSPLRYETHEADGRSWVFVTALLFRMSGLRVRALPGLRLGYPQINVRLYVIDGDGVAATLFYRTLAPWWAVPPLRFVVRRPAVPARLEFPRSRVFVDHDEARWAAEKHGRLLSLRARLGMQSAGPGPSFGSWPGTVSYFHSRLRAYSTTASGVRRVHTARPQSEVEPVIVEPEHTGLLASFFRHDEWDQPHSAWLCPELPLRFLTVEEPETVAASPVTAADIA
ncbi:MAG: DUF2071 domain-containing protein [Acidobacteriota bacterium]